MFFSTFLSNNSLSHGGYLCTRLPRILRLKNFIKLFQCATLRLNKKEVYDEELEDVKESEKDVEPVSDLGVISHNFSEGEVTLLTLFNATGAAKVLTKPAQPLTAAKTAIPFALMSFDRTSAGYTGCIGVYPKAKVAPKT